MEREKVYSLQFVDSLELVKGSNPSSLSTLISEDLLLVVENDNTYPNKLFFFIDQESFFSGRKNLNNLVNWIINQDKNNQIKIFLDLNSILDYSLFCALLRSYFELSYEFSVENRILETLKNSIVHRGNWKEVPFYRSKNGSSFHIVLNNKNSRSTPEQWKKINQTIEEDNGNSIKLVTKIGIISDIYRYLSNLPANLLTPTTFVQNIKEILDFFKITSTVLDYKQIKEKGMNLLAAVGSTNQQSYLVTASRKSKKGRIISLVGKGIIFDTGGLCLKAADPMFGMKFDMCGAALCLCSFLLSHLLEIDLNLNLVLPICENSIGGLSYRPGDIITAYSGDRVEIVNTDAEGRLILADAVNYTEKDLKSDLILDVATLTGLSEKFFGSYTVPFMSNDEKVIEDLIIFNSYNKDLLSIEDRMNFISREFLSLIPSGEEYNLLLSTPVANIKNLAKTAGTITGGLFIKHFIKNKKTSWIHFDIANQMPDNMRLMKKSWGLWKIISLLRKLERS